MTAPVTVQAYASGELNDEAAHKDACGIGVATLDGSRIQEGQDGGGFRDFLDDRTIHAGSGIDLWVAGHWLPGRYEMDYHSKQGYFHTRLFDPQGDRETVIRIDRRTMRFRWPPRSPSDDINERYTQVVQEMTLRGALREVNDIVERGLRDEDHEETIEEISERRRYTLLDIRELVNAVLYR